MIRKAEIKDLKFINEIYNQAVYQKHQTAHTSPISIDETIKWYDNHEIEQYPIFVYEKENQIVGWMSLSAYRAGRKALETSTEISYYIHKDFQGQGIGTKFLSFAISNSKNYGFRYLIAILLESNIRSISILEKFKFEKWGSLPKIALIDGKKYDHLYYGLKLY